MELMKSQQGNDINSFVQNYEEIFDENGDLLSQEYEKKIERFLDEFDWYLKAFKNQRIRGVPY